MSIESELVKALRFAVDGEKRFGIRDDCQKDLDLRWSIVIDLLAQLIAQVKKVKKVDRSSAAPSQVKTQ